MVDAGIDESKSDSILVLSAVVGNAGLMRKLDAEWRRELAESGVDYFHATEHWNGNSKAYHGIARHERDKLLDRLICHFHSRFMFAATVFVDEEEFVKVTTPRFRSQYGSPYGFGFQELMMLVNLELTRLQRRNQPINILIEDGHKNAQQAIGFIEHKKKKLDPSWGLRVGSYGLGSKKDYPILQAADLVAFGMCEWAVKGQSDFAARTFPPKYKKRFPKLPWHRSSVDSVHRDITLHGERLKRGMPGAKRRTELVMW